MTSLGLIDTNVFLHVLGNDERMREACASVLRSVAERHFDAIVSVESILEIFHVRERKTGDRAEALKITRSISESYDLIGLGPGDLASAFDLAKRYPALGPRDGMILAAAINAGADAIITTDRGFTDIDEIKFVDPTDETTLRALLL